MADDIRRIRTVGLLAEGGAGKTTLAEALLYAAGVTTRQGRVDDGNSVFDFEPEEIRRKASLSTAPHSIRWQRHDICLLDPPGLANFLSDTRYAMEAMTGAVFVASPTGQLKVESERVWGWANLLQLPRVVCLSRMDREEGGLDTALNGLRDTLEGQFVPVQLPVGFRADFRGVVDLLTMKALMFSGDNGAVEEGDIPAELQAEADTRREQLVEAIAELDDELLNRYLEGEDIAPDEFKAGLSKAVAAAQLFPVLCVSGGQCAGVRPLLNAMVDYLPSPDRTPAASGKHPTSQEDEERSPDPAAPFSARVFKTLDSPTGRLSLMRVCSGTLAGDSVVYNSSRDARERLGQLFRLDGKKQQPVASALPGEVVAVAKLKGTRTGDTLCAEKAPIALPPMPEFSPSISFALGLKARGDEEKILSSLNRLAEEDMALKVGRDSQSNDILISGAGQLHIEVVVEKLKRRYGVEVELKTPKVPYRETISRTAEAQGRLKKQSGGRGQFGDTWIKLEPLPRGAGFEFVDQIRGGAIPRQYIPSVEKGAVGALAKGFLAHYPIVDIRVTLYDGSYHEVDSSDMAFQIAASIGIQNALEKAKPVILEPIMQMEITVPEEYTGDITGDLNRRRGRLNNVDARGNTQIIQAAVPMAEILSYAPDLRSMTSGRGTFEMAFSHYEEVPHHLTGKVIEEANQTQEE